MNYLLADDSHEISRLVYPKFKKLSSAALEEHGGAVVECLTWYMYVCVCVCVGGGGGGSRLTRGTALCPCSRHFILCLVLV